MQFADFPIHIHTSTIDNDHNAVIANISIFSSSSNSKYAFIPKAVIDYSSQRETFIALRSQ